MNRGVASGALLVAAVLAGGCGRDAAPVETARAAAAPAAAPTDPSGPPALLRDAEQLLVVVTPDWDTVTGELRRYERPSPSGDWRAVGAPVTIVVGKSGTAWDPALTPVVPGPVKREGDGRSPAGVFALGSAFGLAAPAEAAWLTLPYVQEVPTLECVDDPASVHYNRLVDRSTVAAVDWKSSEKMAAVGEAYRWGVVVEYNTSPPVPGQGSCIFLHVSPTPGQGTAGCTAMAAPALDEVLRWLDPAKRPVLVQMPKAVCSALAAPWKLPE
jgi:D-alanyl-D-alanine dipeptidase